MATRWTNLMTASFKSSTNHPDAHRAWPTELGFHSWTPCGPAVQRPGTRSRSSSGNRLDINPRTHDVIVAEHQAEAHTDRENMSPHRKPSLPGSESSSGEGTVPNTTPSYPPLDACFKWEALFEIIDLIEKTVKNYFAWKHKSQIYIFFQHI